MDLQSNLPFDLKFQQGTNKNNVEIEVNRFYRTESEFYNEILNPSLIITENRYLNVIFQSNNPKARLYMYGLDSLPDHQVEVDEFGEVYISPSKDPIAIYSNDYYPLIPGSRYQIKIQVEDKYYYAPFVISSKQVTSEQLDLMKDDLEEMVIGLAIDFVKKSYSFGQDKVKYVSPKLLRQFMLIKRHFPDVIASLSDLYEKVNFRIRKQYKWVPKAKATIVDGTTMKNVQRHPEYRDYLKVPFREVDYDLPENQWVKRIIRDVLAILDDFILSVDRYQQELENEILENRKFEYQEHTKNVILEKEKALNTLIEYRELVERLRIGFQLLSNTSWFQEVTLKAYTHIPHVLTTDSRYRSLFQLRRDLQNEDIEVSIDPAYTFQWKRTDKLYEMWGFVKVLNLLQNDLGFFPVAGWVYDTNNAMDIILIPSLPSGTKIVLQKGDLRIHYTYEGRLPLAEESTDLLNKPLYMGKNNFPDGRLDFYKGEIYAGSLIIDFKYKPINNFWRNHLLDDIRRYKEMEQLIAYSRDSRSKFLYGEKEGKKTRDMYRPRPVYEAWAMYAEKDEQKQKAIYLESQSLRIIPLIPDMSYTYISQYLEDIIQRVTSVLDSLYQN